MITLSSVLVFILANPLAESKDLQELVHKPISRLYDECSLLVSVKNGDIPTREDIQEIQEMIEGWDNAKYREDYDIFHSFTDGMYTREMHVEKDQIIVGEIHRNEHIVNLLKGRLIVIDEFGNRELSAPCSFVSKPGVKRVGFILEDTVWQDIHRTDATTIPEAEAEIFVKNYSEIEINQEVAQCPELS